MTYAAIGVGVVLAGLGIANAQPTDGELSPATGSAVEHASLRPVGDEVAPLVPALPPELPALFAGEVDPEPGSASGVDDRNRDPFRPFTLDLQPEVVAEDEFRTPLQRYDLKQLTVVGVLLDIEPPRAMVQDDAGMGYIVTPGTLIGRRSGIVTDVQPRQVIVEQTFVDFHGREQIRRAVMAMPEEDAIGKPSSEPGRN